MSTAKSFICGRPEAVELVSEIQRSERAKGQWLVLIGWHVWWVQWQLKCQRCQDHIHRSVSTPLTVEYQFRGQINLIFRAQQFDSRAHIQSFNFSICKWHLVKLPKQTTFMGRKKVFVGIKLLRLSLGGKWVAERSKMLEKQVGFIW